jgi:hypothetical protein
MAVVQWSYSRPRRGSMSTRRGTPSPPGTGPAAPRLCARSPTIWPQYTTIPAAAPVPDRFDWDLWLGPEAERPYSPDYAVALRTGKKLLYDGVSQKVTNLADANRYLGREYRKGWDPQSA